MKSNDRQKSSRSGLCTPLPPGDCSLTNSNEGLRPGSPTASLRKKAPQTPVRRSGLVALELPLLTKRKTSQVPMRRQLSRRVPRKDSQRNPRLTKSLSISSTSTYPQLGNLQTSVDPHCSLPRTELQGFDGRGSPDILRQSVRPSSAQARAPTERNPLRRVSRMLTAAGPALVRKVSRLGSSHAAVNEGGKTHRSGIVTSLIKSTLY
ncbi:hypothetical protein FHG87_000031 [Trinorchestia longiramus]|nr:hypothetical protein FHG87_000031 [Trinorchestia longiramus]